MYVGSCSGVFYAFDPDTGEVAWRHDTAQDGMAAQFHGDALLTAELVVVGSDAKPMAHIYAFERSSGVVRWKVAFPSGVGVDMRLFGDTVLAASMSGDVVAIDLASGTVAWSVRSELELTPQALPVDPALIDGHYYVPWRSGYLDAYDATTGALVWRRELPATPNTSVVAVDDALVLGLLDGRLLRLEREDGALAAELTIGTMVYGELVVAGDCLLALVAPVSREREGDALFCVQPDLSGERWRYATLVRESFGTFEPLVRDEQVVAGVRGRLFGVAISDGSLLWTYPIQGLPRGLGASPSTLYVGTFGGLVSALPWLPD